MKRLLRAVSLLGLALAMGGSVAAQTTINNYPAAPSTYMGFFGKGLYPWLVAETYGQVFTAPVDPVLTGLSFWTTNFDDPSYAQGLKFEAYVMAWSGDRATGSVLYQSGLVDAPTVVVPTRQRFDFNVPDLELTPGALYVAFLSTSGHFADTPQEVAHFDVLTGDHRSDLHGFWYQDSEDDPTAWTGRTWIDADSNWDLAIEADFQPLSSETIPEPATLFLLGTGLAALASRRRRRS